MESAYAVYSEVSASELLSTANKLIEHFHHLLNKMLNALSRYSTNHATEICIQLKDDLRTYDFIILLQWN